LTIVYITSNHDRAGKTMLSAGLIKIWQKQGRKVGFVRLAEPGNVGSDGDMVFIQSLLADSDLHTAGKSTTSVKSADLADYCRIYYPDRDIILVESLSSTIQTENRVPGSKVVFVLDYYEGIENGIKDLGRLSGNIKGIIVNKIPRRNLVKDSVNLKELIKSSRIDCLGLIPEDRKLLAPSIGDLALAVNGKILNNPEMSDELIENIMLGSSTFDRGPAYYNRKNNKAVLLWGDRPGFRKAVIANYQLFALQTSTRCIVISNSGEPLSTVLEKAQTQKVPLISAPGTLPEVAANLENYVMKSRFNQVNKMILLEERLPEFLGKQTIEAKLD
jgi:BioD-like phosphotransacetylase family protein